MLPSNSKYIAVLVLTLLVSACASLDLGNDTDADGNSTTSSETIVEGENPSVRSNQQYTSKGVESEGSKELGVAVFAGVDPMADIQINPEIKKTYSKVAKLDKEKKYTQAHNLLDGIKVKYPQLSGPDYQKARIYFSQGQLDKALDAVNLSLKNNSRNYYSLNLKGIILREQGKFLEAKAIYFKAIEVYPPYPNSHLNLGVLADIYLRDLPLALIQYREYMKLTGNIDKTVSNWIIELERRIKSGG